jgi:hypothetical protein
MQELKICELFAHPMKQVPLILRVASLWYDCDSRSTSWSTIHDEGKRTGAGTGDILY